MGHNNRMFCFYKAASKSNEVDSRVIDMALPSEGQTIICGECGAPMSEGVIQRGGTIRFVCTRNFGHILLIRLNN